MEEGGDDAIETALDDDEDEEELPILPPPPIRRQATPTAPGARLPRTQRPLAAPALSGTSSWLSAPRDGWTAQQAQRSKELSASREGRSVRERHAIGDLKG